MLDSIVRIVSKLQQKLAAPIGIKQNSALAIELAKQVSHVQRFLSAVSELAYLSGFFLRVEVDSGQAQVYLEVLELVDELESLAVKFHFHDVAPRVSRRCVKFLHRLRGETHLRVFVDSQDLGRCALFREGVQLLREQL